MALQSTTPGNYPGHTAPPRPFAKVRKHGTTMAFTTGDVFVLTTADWDENNNPRDYSFPVETFCMERISHRHPFTYAVRLGDGSIVTGHESAIDLNKYLSIKPAQPLTEVPKWKGKSTLFQIEVKHGYRVHYLDYVEKKLPEIYNQLQFS